MLIPQILISDDSSPSFNQDDITKLAKEMSLLDIDKLCSENIHTNLNKSYIPKNLKSSEFVWLRTDRVRKPLEAPYTGPFKVLQRTDKHFTIELTDKSHSTVSIDRLKPCTLPKCNTNIQSPNNNNSISQEALSDSDHQSDPDMGSIDDTSKNVESKETVKTRSGRRIKFSPNNSFHYY